MKVLKFGGSSVATVEKIKGIAAYLKERTSQEKLVVVVSAMGKTTNALLDLAAKTSKQPNQRELDRLLSTGEQQTIALLAMALCDIDVPAISLTGIQVGIQTSGIHTKSTIRKVETTVLEESLAEHDVVIVAGFQGVNHRNDVTTLGRGGSDTTAVALAAALDCDCEIYTDVAGVYTTDPRIYPEAKKISEISYEEMMEMSALGSKVMEPRSVELGQKYGVKIYVGKTLSKERGTYIMKSTEITEEKVISAVSANDRIIHVQLDKLGGAASEVANVFKVMSSHHVNVDMISHNLKQEGCRIEFTCNEDEEAFLKEGLAELQKANPEMKVRLDKEVSKISVVGIGMRNAVGVAAGIFEILEKNNIPFYQVTTSEISISLIIETKNSPLAVKTICETYQL
jgi:aspartate kinase